MKRFSILVAAAIVGTVLGWLVPVSSDKVIAGQAFSTTYSWLQPSDSTGNVPDTQGTTTQAGEKVGRIAWGKDISSLTVAVKGIYPPATDTCTAMYDNTATDSVWLNVWTGDNTFDYRRKIYSYKYHKLDTTWESFTVPSDSGIATNIWFQLVAKIKDSSLACAATGTKTGIYRQLSISAWGR